MHTSIIGLETKVFGELVVLFDSVIGSFLIKKFDQPNDASTMIVSAKLNK